MGVRKIKSFGGQKQTQPIQDPKFLREIIFLLKSKIDKAKTPVKRYQAYAKQYNEDNSVKITSLKEKNASLNSLIK